jgi:hypothetical protein
MSPLKEKNPMRLRFTPYLALAVALSAMSAGALLHAQDPDRVVAGGGVFVKGWTGRIDPASARQGRTLNDAKFVPDGAALHVTTGPATTFWNPANTASGDYTIKATFMEPRFMELNSHPHSYGIFIGGHNMGSDQMSLVYCVAYGSGAVLIRGFGPGVFTLLQANNPAVHRAPGVGKPVTQEIAWHVKGGRAECSVNGTVVAGYDKADLVAPGKLQALDGVYGIRFTHNVEAVITGFGMTQG